MDSLFFVVEVVSRQKRFEWAKRLHREYFYVGTYDLFRGSTSVRGSTPTRGSQQSRFLQPSVHGTLTRRPSRSISTQVLVRDL